jgi:hypothetical protein
MWPWDEEPIAKPDQPLQLFLCPPSRQKTGASAQISTPVEFHDTTLLESQKESLGMSNNRTSALYSAVLVLRPQHLCPARSELARKLDWLRSDKYDSFCAHDRARS